MVDLDPPPPPQSAGEVLGTGRLPNDLVAAFSDRLRVTKEDGGPLPPEKPPRQGVYSLLSHLASGVDPVTGFEQVGIL